MWTNRASRHRTDDQLSVRTDIPQRALKRDRDRESAEDQRSGFDQSIGEGERSAERALPQGERKPRVGDARARARRSR